MANKSIDQIVDYPKIKKIAATLWQPNLMFHGAAVMVGAGFSRCAAQRIGSDQKLPLWNEFKQILQQELQSDSSDPLRLAEEYRVMFGQMALHDFIKRNIQDHLWQPGNLHRDLLALPWSEVLTTNWDTLLEKAAKDLHHPLYATVHKQEDLVCTTSPRITKLHGTIERSYDLIFAQEDYRTYAQKYAAFVNFVHRVLIENELCLLGFSGDDPNFLQWLGWVRDVLKKYTRRVYLVGVLNLNVSKRRYLESLNIETIDLYEVVADYDVEQRHIEASKIFLHTLQQLKPKASWEWLPEVCSFENFENDGVLRQLEQERLSYPNWLLCPSDIRSRVHNQIQKLYLSHDTFIGLTNESQVKYLYELAWRHKISHTILPAVWIDRLFDICDLKKSHILTKSQRLEIALLLLDNVEVYLNRDALKRKLLEILEHGKTYDPNIVNELTYYHALIARDELNYEVLEEKTHGIDESSPIWQVRKAMLLAEIGEIEQGEHLLMTAYNTLLEQYRHDCYSIDLLSQLAWVYWLVRRCHFQPQVMPFDLIVPFDYRKARCDPWEHIEALNDQIDKNLDEIHEAANDSASRFYRERQHRSNVQNVVDILLWMNYVLRTVGIPLSWNNRNIWPKNIQKIFEFKEIPYLYRCVLAVRFASFYKDKAIDRVLSRMHVACLDQHAVDFLLNQSQRVIQFWEKRLGQPSKNTLYVIRKLELFIEILARVSCRATSEQAIIFFRFAVSLATEWLSLQKLYTAENFTWFIHPVNHLLQSSLISIAKEDQAAVLLDALSYPLPKEAEIGHVSLLANPIIHYLGQRPLSSELDHRIDQMIESLSLDEDHRGIVLSRLQLLIKQKFLTDAEFQKINRKLWGEHPDYSVLPVLNSGYLNLLWILLDLPDVDTSMLRARIREKFFERKDKELFKIPFLKNLVNLSQVTDSERPSPKQALDYFEKLIDWQKNNLLDVCEDSYFYPYSISRILAEVVVPALENEALTQENFHKVCKFYEKFAYPEILPALPYFARADETLAERVILLIQQALFSMDDKHKLYAASALLIWRDLQDTPRLRQLIKRFIYMIHTYHSNNLGSLLRTVNDMLKKQYVDQEEIDFLVETLPMLFNSLNYDMHKTRDNESLVHARAACVCVADTLLLNVKASSTALHQLLDSAKQDPIPEVRLALEWVVK